MRRVVYVALHQFCEFDPTPRRLLQEAGFDVRENSLGRGLNPEELFEVLRDADAVLAAVEPYNAKLLGALPRLRCISRCGTGTDSIDLTAARRLGIAVYTTPDEIVEPVAQITLAMILALARHLPQHVDDVREGRWVERAGRLLSEWTIGLVGFGRIGRAVEQYLRPFGPTVLVADPKLTQADLPTGVTLRTLEALLPVCDAVSLHARCEPRPPEALLGRRELAMMKPGSVLVNTARGYLVDEAALVEALQSGRLSGAALDVFDVEPYAGPLARLPQVLCTPHVASYTRASRAAMERRCAQHVIEHFAARRSLAVVVS